MRIVRLKPYLRAMERMGLDDLAMTKIESELASAPEAHPVRFALPGRGKSGGGRVIYYVAVETAIYMMTAYPKNERDDLSPDQRKAILAVIDRLKGEER